MDTQYGWLLILVCFLPTAGAIVIFAAIQRGNRFAVRRTAAFTAAADLALAIPLWFLYRPDGEEFQFASQFDWISALGVQFLFGVDGLAVLLILLTALIGFVVVLGSTACVAEREKEFYAILLLLQTGVIGVYCSLDLMLFFTFLELLVLPVFFLVGIWGGARRVRAAVKLLIVHLVGAACTLVGILTLAAFNAGGLTAAGGGDGGLTFALPELYAIAGQIPHDLQGWIFVAFFASFAIRIPLAPLHTWLPEACAEAPPAAAVVLTATVTKVGLFGLVRLSMPLLPVATREAAGWVGAVAVGGLVYGVMVAMVQKDMKRLIAMLSVGATGMIVLGMITLNESGMTGSLLQLLNHGISFGALLLLVGMLEQRRGTRLIGEYGGLAGVVPVFATFFLLVTLSIVGLPGFNGFVGHLMVIMGVFDRGWIWILLALAGLVVLAATVMWLYQRVFLGEVANEQNRVLRDLEPAERWLLVPLVAVILWVGLAPRPFLDRLEPTVERVLERVGVEVVSSPEVPAVRGGLTGAADEDV